MYFINFRLIPISNVANMDLMLKILTYKWSYLPVKSTALCQKEKQYIYSSSPVVSRDTDSSTRCSEPNPDQPCLSPGIGHPPLHWARCSEKGLSLVGHSEQPTCSQNLCHYLAESAVNGRQGRTSSWENLAHISLLTVTGILHASLYSQFMHTAQIHNWAIHKCSCAPHLSSDKFLHPNHLVHISAVRK